MIKKKILIATGGSGGHTFPAYSLANYLIKKNFNVKLTTDKRGFNYLKNFKNLNLIKIHSTPLIKRNFFSFIFSIMTIIFSIFKSLIYLLLNRPLIIFGMGGYSSFPICIAAAILRIKFVIYENNLIIGKANKYLLPFTKKLFVSYSELEGIIEKYNNKTVKVGNILREEIINSYLRDRIYQFDSMKILVLGGSQAAKVFADELPKIFKRLNDSGIPIQIFQQCQKKQSQQLSKFYKENNINHEIFNFSDKILDYYSKANLVITRSGASVLAELININIPFISIPLPTSADNHQYKNALFYKKNGYGYLLEEKDIKHKLYELISLLFNDQLLLKKTLSKQKQYSDKDVFKNLDILIEEILNEKN